MIEEPTKCPVCGGSGDRYWPNNIEEENRDCPACKGTGLTLVQPPLENETRVRLQRAGSVSLPSREELALWRSRCAPVSGNWQDMALHRCCMALLGEGTPNEKLTHEAGDQKL